MRRDLRLSSRLHSERLDLEHRRELTVKSADFDQDGDLDLIALPYSSIPMLCLNDGDGHFTVGEPLTMFGEIDEVFVADFNGDGRQDLEGHDGLGSLQLSLQGEDGSFSSPYLIDAGGKLITDVLVTEWDEHPGAEILWESSDPDGLHVASFHGGAWTSRALVSRWGWGHRSHRLAAADVDGDGAQDLVLLETNVVLPQSANGSLREREIVSEGHRLQLAADVDGDDRCDLVVSDYESRLILLSAWPDGSWRERGEWPLYASYTGVNVDLVDFDGDGARDLFVRQHAFYSMGCWGVPSGYLSPSTWQVLYREAKGWRLRETVPVKDSMRRVLVIGRFDADQYPDFILQDQEGIGVGLVRAPFKL